MHRHRFPSALGHFPTKRQKMSEQTEAGTLMPCRVSDGDRMVTFWKVSLACHGGNTMGTSSEDFTSSKDTEVMSRELAVTLR